jgi:hypothetical protein
MEEGMHPAQAQQHEMLREQNRQLVAKARARALNAGRRIPLAAF